MVPKALGAQVLEHRLENGLQLLVVHHADARDVEVTATYFVGMVDGSLRGAAHFMEHLAMRETRDGRGLAARYRELGIDGGAFTNTNATIFGMLARGGAAMLDTLLWFQRQRMTALALTDQAIATERRSIHIEHDGRPLQPGLSELFGKHRLRYGDDHADLDAITRDDLVAFYHRYYTPSNAALVIVSALQDSDVIARAVSVFGAIPVGELLPRPVFRDSTPIPPARWIGTVVSGSEVRRTYVVAVPGPQHPARPALEAAVAALPGGGGSSATVRTRLDDSAPVSTLTLSVADRPGADRSLDSTWRQLLNGVRAGGVNAGHLDTGSLIACEAAGDWRFCLSAESSSAEARASLLALLRAAAGDTSVVAPLWPSAPRQPPRPAVSSVASAAAPRAWRSPATAPIVWHRGPAGLEWAARDGGVPDSVYIAAVLASAESSPSVTSVAALELWARCWPRLRLPSGQLIDSLFTAEGITASVRSLPYPVLATADRFTMMATLPTPIGVNGIEIKLTAPRASGATALRLLGDALATGHVDTAAIADERTRQVGLLTGNATYSVTTAEVTARQRLVAVPAAAWARYYPDSGNRSAETMNRVSATDVGAAGRGLLDHGRGRIAILGADSAMVDGWIAGGKMGRLAALRWPEGAASCPRADTTTRVIRMAPSREQTTLYAYSCIGISPDGAPGAALLVANFILGGSEDAVLARRLRGELGLAYGFSSRVIGVWDAPVAVWLLRIVSQDANADRVIAEIRSLLATVIAEGPSASLLESARTALAKTRLDQATDGLPWVTSVLWRGVAPEVEAQRVRDVTLAEVRDALRRWGAAGVGVVRSGNPQ